MIEPGEADGDALRRRRPGLPVREPRRRSHVGAQPRALGPSDAARLEPGRRRALPAHDRAVARRSRPPDGRDLRRRRLALGRPRRRPGATRTTASSPSTCPRRRRTRRSSTACTTSAARRAGPSACSCSSTAASTARTTPARRWIDVGDGTDLPSDFGFPIVVDPGRPRQRLRDPAHRRRGPDDARRLGARLGDARRGRDLDAARRRAAAGATPT